MKKVLLLFVAIVSVLYASAQDVDSLKRQTATVSLDSLSLKLNKLQHDYDFMYCEYKLKMLSMDLKDLSLSINNSSDKVVIQCYNCSFDRELFNTYLKLYDAYQELINSLKNRIEVTKMAVLAKIVSSDFSDADHDLLNSFFDYINESVAATENDLQLFYTTLKAYLSKS